LASALDPRLKSLKFAQNRYEITYKLIAEEIKSIKDKISEDSQIARSATIIQKDPSMNTIFDDLFDNSSQQTSDDELDKYINMVNVAGDVDPFIWWRERKEELPTLSILASKYLCLGATSVPSERLFSDVGVNWIEQKWGFRVSESTITRILQKSEEILNTDIYSKWCIIIFSRMAPKI